MYHAARDPRTHLERLRYLLTTLDLQHHGSLRAMNHLKTFPPTSTLRSCTLSRLLKPTIAPTGVKHRRCTSSALAPSKMQYHSTMLDGVEYVQRYRKGGYHPVHLEDTLDDGKYRILHKLGSGGSSTVWMARDNDTQQLVSLKILTASASQEDKDLKMLHYLDRHLGRGSGRNNIVSITNTFQLEGPNGTHTCYVSHIAGPSMVQLIQNAWQVTGSRQLRGALTRSLAKQLAKAVCCMHSAEMIHGGLSRSAVCRYHRAL